jgi:hypothetical protein
MVPDMHESSVTCARCHTSISGAAYISNSPDGELAYHPQCWDAHVRDWMAWVEGSV